MKLDSSLEFSKVTFANQLVMKETRKILTLQDARTSTAMACCSISTEKSRDSKERS